MKTDKLLVSLHKELEAVEKQEYKLYNAATKAKPASWKELIEKRIPEKVYLGLKSAYCKAFALVFNQGRSLIEKSYNKEELATDHVIRDFAVEVKKFSFFSFFSSGCLSCFSGFFSSVFSLLRFFLLRG